MAALIANLQQFEAQEQSFQLQLRAKYTLDALNQIARGLSGIPGRKNLIWFSGSFPINILPDGDLQNPFAVVASAEEEFRETTNMLTASQVAVYPIDARGLMVSPNLNASNSGSKYARNPTTLGKDQSKFFQQTADEHSTMLQMAEQTGGRAFINTNDLTHAVAKSIETGSNFYTLAYSPTDTNWNGSFRKIQVKLQEQGYTLAYRRGYYADNPNAHPKKGAVAATTPANAPPPFDPMRAAMIHGGPDPTQILIKARVLPAASAPEDATRHPQRTQPGPKDQRPLPPLRHRLRRRRPRRPLHQVPRRLLSGRPAISRLPLRPGWKPNQPRRRQDPRHPHRRRLHRPVTPRRPLAPGDQRPSQRQLLPPHRPPRPHRRPRRCRRSSHRLRQKSTLTRGSKEIAAAPAVTLQGSGELAPAPLQSYPYR